MRRFIRGILQHLEMLADIGLAGADDRGDGRNALFLPFQGLENAQANRLAYRPEPRRTSSRASGDISRDVSRASLTS